jgi:hypothetical protein
MKEEERRKKEEGRSAERMIGSADDRITRVAPCDEKL